MWPMRGDAHYLVREVGFALTLALSEVTQRMPPDPIEFLSSFIYKYAESKLYHNEALSQRVVPLTQNISVESSLPSVESIASIDPPDLTLLHCLCSDDAERRIAALIQVRKLLSVERKPPIDAVLQLGFLPVLVGLLTDANVEIQFEAAWAVTNIACGNSNQTQAVAEAGAVPLFIQMLHSPNEDVREQAVWALANIMGDSPSQRDAILAQGVLPPLLALVKTSGKASLQRNLAWALGNAARGKNPPVALDVMAQLIPVLHMNLTSSDDTEVLQDTLWCLAYLTDGTNDRIQCIVDAGFVPLVMQHLRSHRKALHSVTIRVLGNIATGEEAQTQMVLDVGIVPWLMEILPIASSKILKECLWILSNIAAGTESQANVLLQLDVVPAVIPFITHPDLKVSREAIWIVANLCDNDATLEDTKDLLLTNAGLEKLWEVSQKADPTINKVIKTIIPHFVDIFNQDERVKWYSLWEDQQGDSASASRNSKRNSNDDGSSPSKKDEESVSKKMVGNPQRMLTLFENAHNSNAEVKLLAISALRKILSTSAEVNIDAVLQHDFLPILVDCLANDDNETLQYEAAWVITNIASGETHHTEAVVQSGAVKKLIELVTPDNSKLCEQVLWALANIAGESPQYRDHLLELGLLPRLFSVIIPTSPWSLLKQGSFMISNICRYKKQPPAEDLVQSLMPHFHTLLQCPNLEVVEDALTSLAFVTNMNNEMIQMVMDANLIPLIASFLRYSKKKVFSAALRVLGNIVTGPEGPTQAVLDCEVLPMLKNFMEDPADDKILKDCLWLLSNITAGTEAQLEVVLEHTMLPIMIQNIAHSNPLVCKEATWAVRNLCLNGTNEHVKQVVLEGGLTRLWESLQGSDQTFLKEKLKCLQAILSNADEEDCKEYCEIFKSYGGLDFLKSSYSEQAAKIVREYFEDEEKTDEGEIS